MVRNAEIRLECLKLAVGRQGAKDDRPVLDIANDFVAWVNQVMESNSDKPQQARKYSRKTGSRSGL